MYVYIYIKYSNIQIKIYSIYLKKKNSVLKNEGLSITIETNLIVTDFLDFTFNLLTGKYFPFRKVNNKPPNTIYVYI